MLCNVCKDGLEGMWDPSRSKRLALLTDFLGNKSNDALNSHDGGKDEHFLRPH